MCEWKIKKSLLIFIKAKHKHPWANIKDDLAEIITEYKYLCDVFEDDLACGKNITNT